MKKYKLNPKKYDFIWKVNNFDYFFFSFWLNKNYLTRDALFTCRNSDWKTYMSKKERMKTSTVGKKLMKSSKRVSNYRKKIDRWIVKAKKYFSYLKNLNYSKFSNKDLANELVKASIFCNRLWEQYFITEYFYYDTVGEKIQKNIGSRGELNIMKKNIRKMQEVKFHLRSQLNHTIFGKHIFIKIIDEISRRTKIKAEDLYNLGYQEIAGLLNKKKIKTAPKFTYIIGKFSNWKLITGAEADNLINYLESYNLKHTGDILHGKVGNKGYYKGRVKIIPFDVKTDLSKEIKKMKKGDVLVSGSTGPEMILACKKAGAIITEEGGITSHAAIVSRELGIPAVIGTKIATEVLKDGDLVEVDANKGIVNILKAA